MVDAIQIPIPNLEKIGKQTFRLIQLSDLPSNEMLLSPYPSKELIEDIALRGQLDPIQVTERDGKYVVISGRRRIKALRKILEIDSKATRTVKAMVITNIEDGSIMNLAAVENNLRSDNPLTDLEAINYLLSINPQISEREISQQTGIPISRIRKRLKLTNLIPEINTAVISGKISISVAENIAKLSSAKQSELLSIYFQKGKISNEDVVIVQRAIVQEHANTLPDFPEIDSLNEEKIIEYVHIKENSNDRVTFTNINDAMNYKQINGGIVCKLVVIE